MPDLNTEEEKDANVSDIPKGYSDGTIDWLERVTEDIEDGIYFTMPENIYRSLPFANYSAVKTLALGGTPAHYLASHSGDSRTSKAKGFGQLAHHAVLTPEYFEQFKPLPESIKQRRGDDWIALQAANPDIKYLSKSEWGKFETSRDAAGRVAKSIRSHPVAKNIVDKFYPEVVIVWTDKDTGVRCKCRIDVYSPEQKLIADIKTTSKKNPYQIGKSGYYLGYHIQASMYTDAVLAATGTEPKFYFVFVESEPPHLVCIANGHDAYDERAEDSIPGSYLELGRDQYRDALQVIKRCQENNEWEGFPLDIFEMVVPRYANMEGVYDV